MRPLPAAGRRPLEFTRGVRDAIRSIPRGRVATYGGIAALAGDASQARQVAWVLHASPENEALPWHRVIGARGKISLPPSRGGTEQARRLKAEGVKVGRGGSVDLKRYGWGGPAAISPALRRLDLDRLNEDRAPGKPTSSRPRSGRRPWP